MKYLLSISFLCLVLSGARAQDIETVVSAKPVVVSGFVNAGINLIEDNRASALQSPLGYFTTLGVNFNFFGALQVPISFTYADQQTTFQRPSFQTFGVSPSYKWITLHAGYRSFKLSPLLMGGAQVKGLGIELTPGAFQLLVFKGDLTNNFNFGFSNEVIAANDIEIFKRSALGVKVGVGKGQNFVRMSLLKVQDDETTGSLLALDTLSILPKENLGLAVSSGVLLFNRLSLTANVAGSALNSNTRSPLVETEEVFSRLSDVFMEINESTRYAYTYDASIALQINRWRIGAKYQHVDPNYETLGYIFLQQDINNYTGFLSGTMFRSKLILNANVGVQYNNTQDLFAQTEKRVIYNFSANWSIQPGLQWSGTYNNFNTEGNLSITEVVDSLQFTSGNVGYGNSINYQFGPKEGKHSLNLNVAHNSFEIVRAEQVLSTNTSAMYNLSYNKRIKSSGLTYGATLRLSNFDAADANSVSRKGLSLKLQKKMSKSITMMLRPSYDINTTNGISDGSVLNMRFRTNYKVSSKTNLSASVSYRNRRTKVLAPFSQIRLSLAFNSRF